MPIAEVLANKFTMYDLNLSRFAAGEREKIRRMLDGLRDQLLLKLDQQVADGDTFSRRRLQALFKVTDLTIDNTYAKIAKVHDESMLSLAEVSANKSIELVNRTIGVSILNVGVPESVLKAMVKDDISLGLPASEWWDGQGPRLRQRFQNTIRQGVFAGETVSDLKRRVRGRRENGFKDGIMSAASRDAEALIRTSVNSIAQSARLETFKANDDVVKGVQWLSTLDVSTTPQCQALSGSAWTLDGEKLEGTELDFPGPPPVHFSCFPGDTHVSAVGDVSAKSCRPYKGNLVIIHTSSGLKLSCTPNHPILTRNGWVPAHLIKKGFDVVRSLRSEWRGWVENHNDNDVTARIENFPVSLFCSGRMGSMEVPVSTKDFHGDVLRPEIAVIYADSYLLNKIYPSLIQPAMEDAFLFRHSYSPLLSNFGDLFSMALATPYSANSVMRSIRQSLSLLRSGLGHSYIHGFARRSNMAACLFQPAQYGRRTEVEFSRYGFDRISRGISGNNIRDGGFNNSASSLDASTVQNSPDASFSDIELARQIISGQSGPVAFDKIILVENKFFHGSVYNLQTENMFYMANSIIVHNCRSSLVPAMKSWGDLIRDAKGDKDLAKRMDAMEGKLPKSTQASMDGQVSSAMNYEQWLERQPEERQIEALGEGKWELWKKGDIALTDLIDTSGRPLSLKDLEAL